MSVILQSTPLTKPHFTNSMNVLHNIGLTNASSSSEVREQMSQLFNKIWLEAAKSSSKLMFYTYIKSTIQYEPYLSIRDTRKRGALAKLRSSSHRLNIETGRYVDYKTEKSYSQDSRTWNKCCRFCNDDNAEYLIALPFTTPPILEDERHVLVSCPKYHHIRLKLSDNIKTSLMLWDISGITELFSANYVNEFASYVHNIFEIRSSPPQLEV